MNAELATIWLQCLDMAYRHNLALVKPDGTPDTSLAGRYATADQIYERALQGPPPKAEKAPADE